MGFAREPSDSHINRSSEFGANRSRTSLERFYSVVFVDASWYVFEKSESSAYERQKGRQFVLIHDFVLSSWFYWQLMTISS